MEKKCNEDNKRYSKIIFNNNKFDLKLNIVFIFLFVVQVVVKAQSQQESLPEINYHLTHPDWQPLNISSNSYLDAVEGIVTIAEKFQDKSGAIIDPFLHREHQYTTPYYAFAVGALISANRSLNKLPSGIRAMEKALTDFSNGSDSIPDQHGEFFIAALTEAMELYKEHIPNTTYEKWKKMISVPLDKVWSGMDGHLNNWRTYALKGEWARAIHGFADKEKTIELIEESWKNGTQYERIGITKWNLYEDWSSDPQSLAVEAVGRGNLTALAMSGYDGPSATQIKESVRKGALTSMLLMSPTGQAPPNGRTDNHVFNDILYQLVFEVMAEDAFREKKFYLAGQYRRSAQLAFKSIARWKRTDEDWKDSYSIAKNHFNLDDRTGYQPSSQWGNYSGAMMFHLAEAYLTHKSDIQEKPAPTEIGGYALQIGDRFSTFTANAGGMQVFINLRGASVPKYNMYWTPLGGVRFSKTNWDDRLGPSDGKRLFAQNDSVLKKTYIGNPADAIYPKTGLTFGPTWMHKGKWVRIADMATHYQGTVNTEFVHPLLVKFSVTYAHVTGFGGPYFKQEFIVTPDGVMTYLSSPQNIPLAVTVPLLANDGQQLETQIANGIATTGYKNAADTQNFIGLNSDIKVSQDGEAIKSTYGMLLPIKFQSQENSQIVFVYPKSKSGPDAEKVKESFVLAKNGFTSILGSVEGTIYIGEKMAGGYGNALDLNKDGTPEITFDAACRFIVQLTNGKITKVETDKAVNISLKGKKYYSKAFEPLEIK
ncbi:hypothetical protein JQC67_04830 [Aurantibacter crassamenti]|uniref:hypothetical protein n=1 Tax=Aurantibacter crassamenti TaxID=1837375 RepID=UPI00193A138C|nr:hypothetical protein [Aurantibacter crassamenti]MBM1105461.1 hypothetical protein [Aurantibacter crassamenti]